MTLKKIMNSMAILGYIIAASHVFSRALHSFLKCLCTEHYKCVYHHALSYTLHLYQANIFLSFDILEVHKNMHMHV